MDDVLERKLVPRWAPEVSFFVLLSPLYSFANPIFPVNYFILLHFLARCIHQHADHHPCQVHSEPCHQMDMDILGQLGFWFLCHLVDAFRYAHDCHLIVAI